MANADRPSGFMPVRHAFGGVIRANPWKIADGYGTSIFTGDAVILTSGRVEQAGAESTVLLGVFAGCQYTLDTGEIKFSKYWPASTALLGTTTATAMVYDDPGIVFEVQTDTGTDFTDTTHIAGSYDIELDHAGSATTGQSGMEIDLGDTGQTQFFVLGLRDIPDNANGTNAKIEVMMRKCVLKLA